MDLVQEQHRGPAVEVPVVQRLVHDRPHVFDAGVDGGQLHELAARSPGDHGRQGRLAGAGRPIQNERRRPGTAAALAAGRALGQLAQWGTDVEQVLLADHLVYGARAHAHSQGGTGAIATARGGAVVVRGARCAVIVMVPAAEHTEQITHRPSLAAAPDGLGARGGAHAGRMEP
ncbi:hypothetical protein CITRIK5_30479 [Citricoccus sp. K5]|nr:hypothetical protein CITRIK5_30479 [Citricoccus sp. K5]